LQFEASSQLGRPDGCQWRACDTEAITRHLSGHATCADWTAHVQTEC